MDSLMDKLFDIIPEFYYDLIGRVVPGAIASIALFAAYGFDFLWLVEKLGTVLTGLTVLIASYFFGLVFDLISKRLLSGIVWIWNKLPGHELKLWTDNELWTKLVDIGKKIEMKDSDNWKRSQVHVLNKMMAERSLLRVAIFELILIAPTFYLLQPKDPTIPIIAILFLPVVLLAFISLHLCLKKRIEKVTENNQSQA